MGKEITRNSSTKGIVVKIWDVKNTKGADGKADLNASINYIDDEKKTTVMVNDLDHNLNKSINYAVNDLKTMHKALVGGYLINDMDNAVQEMIDIKRQYGKTNGRTAVHGIISLDEEESGIDNSGKLISMTRDILTEIFPNHQFVYAVHTNTENLHIHFIVNSVGMDGQKIHRKNDFIREVLQPTVNDKALLYGFSPNSKWLEKKTQEKISFKERKILLRQDIDRAIEKAVDFDTFCNELREKGYRVNVGKHMSLQNEYMDKAIRSYQLGDRYTIDEITSRIACRSEDFRFIKATKHTEDTHLDYSFFKIAQLPQFKDMTKEQKQEVILMLKQGRNPWEEQYRKAWQYQRLNKKIQLESNARNIVDAYVPGGTVKQAMEEIIARQRQITEQRRFINSNIRNYKPIKEIYFRMRKLQTRAYLYEFCGSDEYEEEYLEYIKLVDRLRDGYNKTPEDVYEFLNDQSYQLMYLSTQKTELNKEYRLLRKYLTDDVYRARQTGLKLSLKEVTGYQDEVMVASKTGVTVADTAYIASKNSDYIIRMTKSAYIDSKGKPKQEVEFVVLDRYGTIMDEIRLSETESLKEFDKRVDEFSQSYGFRDCYKCSSFKEAKVMLRKEQDFNNPFEDIEPNKKRSMKQFMAAINHLSVRQQSGYHSFKNRINGEYTCVVHTAGEHISLEIKDRHNETIEKAIVPGFYERNYDGYQALVRIRDKYGFKDELQIEDSLEEQYIREQKTIEKQQTRKIL